MGIERGDNERGLGNQWGLSGEKMKEGWVINGD